MRIWRNLLIIPLISLKKALDLGAGNLFDVACLKQLGWQAYGVDLTTGVDLEKPYLSPKEPFDLVYSNYVIHKLKHPEQLIHTAWRNLKPGGWIFIHTFHKNDKNSKSALTERWFKKILGKYGFNSAQYKTFAFYDNAANHKHWHKILEVKGRKI